MDDTIDCLGAVDIVKHRFKWLLAVCMGWGCATAIVFVRPLKMPTYGAFDFSKPWRVQWGTAVGYRCPRS
jgi:hypothetical protein